MEKIQLFCLPYAGGSAGIYNKWKKMTDNTIEVCPIEYKGRGSRFNETLSKSMGRMVDDVFEQIKGKINSGQYAFFGYSMGSMIAYEVIRKLEKSGYKPPIHSFFAAKQAPHLHEQKKLHLMNDRDFLEEIYKLGGTPKELRDNQELMEIYVSILKADYEIVDTYEHDLENNKIGCNISVLYGKEDRYSVASIREWSNLTNKDFQFYAFEGGHFFMNHQLQGVIEVVSSELQKAQKVALCL